MNSLLQVKNLSYEYEKDKKILNNLNLTFEKGKSYAIIGQSGKGKTTLISLLGGLEKIQDGDILLEDKSIKSLNLDDYRATKVGVIFQQYNLLNNYSVLDNILIAMKIANKKLSEETAFDLLKKVGLDEDMAFKMPLELSGGQQQRVAIARTLAKETDVIIADEPTGNLDGQTEKEIINLLLDIVQKENKILIIATHSDYVSHELSQIYDLNTL